MTFLTHKVKYDTMILLKITKMNNKGVHKFFEATDVVIHPFFPPHHYLNRLASLGYNLGK